MATSKQERQKALRRLLSVKQLYDQNEVVNALRAEGFDVTQPTVSRDLTELKVRTHPNGYYIPGATDEQREQEATLGRLLKKGAVRIAEPGSVVSTVLPVDDGVERFVAGLIKNTLPPDDLLGCITGERCVVVLHPNADAAMILRSLLERVRRERDGV